MNVENRDDRGAKVGSLYSQSKKNFARHAAGLQCQASIKCRQLPTDGRGNFCSEENIAFHFLHFYIPP